MAAIADDWTPNVLDFCFMYHHIFFTLFCFSSQHLSSWRHKHKQIWKHLYLFKILSYCWGGSWGKSEKKRWKYVFASELVFIYVLKRNIILNPLVFPRKKKKKNVYAVNSNDYMTNTRIMLTHETYHKSNLPLSFFYTLNCLLIIIISYF